MARCGRHNTTDDKQRKKKRQGWGEGEGADRCFVHGLDVCEPASLIPTLQTERLIFRSIGGRQGREKRTEKIPANQE